MRLGKVGRKRYDIQKDKSYNLFKVTKGKDKNSNIAGGNAQVQCLFTHVRLDKVRRQ